MSQAGSPKAWSKMLTHVRTTLSKSLMADGTVLMNKSCGYMKVNESDPNFFVPPNITSNTNLVTVFFSTDGTGAKTGWTLNWRAVVSG